MHILPQSEMFKRLQTTKSIFRPLGLCPGPLCIHCDTLKILITTRTSTVQTMTYSMQLDCFHFHTHHTVTSVYLKYTAANLKLFKQWSRPRIYTIKQQTTVILKVQSENLKNAINAYFTTNRNVYEVTNYYKHFMAPGLSGTTRVSRYQKAKTRKVKPIWIYWSKM